MGGTAMNMTPWRRRETLNGGLARLRDEMEGIFDRFLGEPLGLIEPKSLRLEGWIPPLDVSETGAEVMIRVPRKPGARPRQVEVESAGRKVAVST
jgi:HSP20 family molecular chaperone IbpA